MDNNQYLDVLKEIKVGDDNIKVLEDILINLEKIKRLFFNSCVDDIDKNLFVRIIRNVYFKRDKLTSNLLRLHKKVIRYRNKKSKV